MQAVTVESQVLQLQTKLMRQGKDAILPALTKGGVKEINGVPLAEASDDDVAEYLSGVYQGARLAQIQAQPRKQFILQRAASFAEATKVMPEISDPKSERGRRVVEILQSAPELRQRPDWPELAVKLVLGGEAWGKTKTGTREKATLPKPVPAPVKQAPAAPRTSTASVPQPKELEVLSKKMADGSASNVDLDRYAVLSLKA
jgi:hypothetical protein